MDASRRRLDPLLRPRSVVVVGGVDQMLLAREPEVRGS